MYNFSPYAERKVLPFFPTAPDEALIFSRCIAYHILAGNRSSNVSKFILFDNEDVRSVDPFGANLKKLIEVLPRNGFSIDHLFEHATLFGFYSRTLSPERKRLWHHNQLSGDARFINKFLTGVSGEKFRPMKENLHFCEMCRREDEVAYGIAHWRVVHQLPGVTHCSVHFTPLSGPCIKCRLPIASENSWHPPSETCPHCGSSSFFPDIMPRLPVHLRFVELCNLAARGIPVGLSIADRKQMYSQFRQQPNQSIDKRIEKLIDVLLKRWEVDSLEELQSFLQVMINRKFVTQAITSQDTIQSPGGHLAVIAALEAEGYTRRKRRANTSEHARRPAPVLSHECQATLDELACNACALLKAIERVCDLEGLPVQMGAMLIDGTQVEATRQFRVDQVRGARLLIALDEIDFIADGIVSSSTPKGSQFNFAFVRNAMWWHKVRNGHRGSVRDFLLRNQFKLSGSHTTILKSIIWLGKNDNAWLRKLYSADGPFSEKIKTMCRKSIVDAIKDGCRIPSAVRRTAPTAFELCRVVDFCWLNSTIPPTKYEGLSFTDRRARCRRMIIVAIEAGINVRSHMPKRAKRWCLANDREWLEQTVPGRLSNGKVPRKL